MNASTSNVVPWSQFEKISCTRNNQTIALSNGLSIPYLPAVSAFVAQFIIIDDLIECLIRGHIPEYSPVDFHTLKCMMPIWQETTFVTDDSSILTLKDIKPGDAYITHEFVEKSIEINEQHRIVSVLLERLKDIYNQYLKLPNGRLPLGVIKQLTNNRQKKLLTVGVDEATMQDCVYGNYFVFITEQSNDG